MTRHLATGPHVVRSVPTGTYGTVRCPAHPDLDVQVPDGHAGAQAIQAHITDAHRTHDDQERPDG